jgi:putative nucleotidyltransferase with HDIG domain
VKRTQPIKKEIDEQFSDLPVLPSIVSKTMELSRDPSCGARDLAKTISLDPGISSKVLRLANSAYYGFASQISTITHAVVVLGFNAVSNLVVGSAVMEFFGGESEGSLFQRYGLWKHSLAAATAARLLAEDLGLPATNCEQAFIGGLLHDVGKALLDHRFPTEWRWAVAQCHERSCNLIEAESDVLGITHPEVGELLANKWGFAETLVGPIAHHHSLAGDGSVPTEVALAHAGDRFAHRAEIGSSGAALVPSLDPRARRELDLSDEAESRYVEKLKERVLDVEEFLYLALPKAAKSSEHAA